MLGLFLSGFTSEDQREGNFSKTKPALLLHQCQLCIKIEDNISRALAFALWHFHQGSCCKQVCCSGILPPSIPEGCHANLDLLSASPSQVSELFCHQSQPHRGAPGLMGSRAPRRRRSQHPGQCLRRNGQERDAGGHGHRGGLLMMLPTAGRPEGRNGGRGGEPFPRQWGEACPSPGRG